MQGYTEPLKNVRVRRPRHGHMPRQPECRETRLIPRVSKARFARPRPPTSSGRRSLRLPADELLGDVWDEQRREERVVRCDLLGAEVEEADVAVLVGTLADPATAPFAFEVRTASAHRLGTPPWVTRCPLRPRSCAHVCPVLAPLTAPPSFVALLAAAALDAHQPPAAARLGTACRGANGRAPSTRLPTTMLTMPLRL